MTLGTHLCDHCPANINDDERFTIGDAKLCWRCYKLAACAVADTPDPDPSVISAEVDLNRARLDTGPMYRGRWAQSQSPKPEAVHTAAFAIVANLLRLTEPGQECIIRATVDIDGTIALRAFH